MIDRSLIEKIQELVLEGAGEKVVIKIDDREYSTIPLHTIDRKLPEPAVLVVSSLTSLIEYLGEDPDGIIEADEQPIIVHVVSPTEVQVRSALFGDAQQRYHFLKAVTTPAGMALAKEAERNARYEDDAPQFAFTKWLAPEPFIIGLQALFADTEQRTALIQLMSNLGTQAEIKIADDGVSQETTARIGTVRYQNVTVPNPVQLAPFRTFREIEQPESPFIFRLRAENPGKENAAMRAALFEADGGAWRDVAIDRIKEFIRESLTEKEVTIIG